jgi:hypothetical protein
VCNTIVEFSYICIIFYKVEENILLQNVAFRQKKFLSCLLTLKTEVDSDSLVPTSTLAHAALDWCNAIGSKAQTVEDILGGSSEDGASHPPDALVMKAIQVRRHSLVHLDSCRTQSRGL